MPVIEVTLSEHRAIWNCTGTLKHMRDKIAVLEISDNDDLRARAGSIQTLLNTIDAHLTELDRIAVAKY